MVHETDSNLSLTECKCKGAGRVTVILPMEIFRHRAIDADWDWEIKCRKMNRKPLVDSIQTHFECHWNWIRRSFSFLAARCCTTEMLLLTWFIARNGLRTTANIIIIIQHICSARCRANIRHIRHCLYRVYLFDTESRSQWRRWRRRRRLGSRVCVCVSAIYSADHAPTTKYDCNYINALVWRWRKPIEL